MIFSESQLSDRLGATRLVGMTKLTADEVTRIRAAKRTICDATILVAVAFEVGDPDGVDAIRMLRRAHRRLSRRLEASRREDSLEPQPGIEPDQASYEEAPSP